MQEARKLTLPGFPEPAKPLLTQEPSGGYQHIPAAMQSPDLAQVMEEALAVGVRT